MEGEHGQRCESGPAPGTLSRLLEEIARAPPVPAGGGGGDDGSGHPGDAVLRAGLRLGRYELVRELGRGGFGVVWEASDAELHRTVALKVLRPTAPRTRSGERLAREAEAAARLSHPNIVTLHDAGRAEVGAFLVFELLEGETLSARLRDGPLPSGEAVRVAVEVAKALAHAHAHGVVHRDLKPENVFLCEEGSVKVLDFGLAHAFGLARVDGGTPAYMAPEQLAGAPEDERTDVFALGAMLFEMLAGRRPFDSATALRSASPAPAVDVPGHAPLGDAVARMLAKVPLQRPRSGGDVLRILTPLQRELQLAPPPAPVHTRKIRRVDVRIAALLAGAVVAAIAWAVAAGLRAVPPARPASVAVLPFSDLSPHHDEEFLADGVAEEILTALSRIEGLRVPGRVSSFYFKGRSDDLRTIGERLNVAHVLEGTVRRSGDRIRVTTELVSVAEGYRVWAESYDRPLGDAFAVQEDIARSVVAGLRGTLAASAAPVPPETRTESADAHAELLRGRHFASRTTERDHRLAIAAFQRATALDPAYAPAWAALALAEFNLPNVSDTATPTAFADAAVRARSSAERAIALAPRLADGWVARALLRYAYDFDWAGSRADLERALALAPHDTRPRMEHAHLLAVLGRVEEAAAITEGVLRDDPLSTNAAWYLASYDNALGRHALARKVLEQAREIAPEHARVIRELAFTDLLEGHPEAALATARRCPIEWMRDLVDALASSDLGRRRESDAALERLGKLESLLAYQIAQIHAWRGESDAAFEWLERARAQHDPGVRYLRFDPFLRKIRDDPRFDGVLRRAGLLEG